MKNLKKILSLLIIFQIVLCCNSFAQDTTINIPTKVAKSVIKDLILLEAIKVEVSKKDSILLKKDSIIIYKNSIIDLKNSQIKNYNSILNYKDSTIYLKERIINSQDKSLSKAKVKNTFFQLGFLSLLVFILIK